MLEWLALIVIVPLVVWLELLRCDSTIVFGLRINQVVAALLALIAGGLLRQRL